MRPVIHKGVCVTLAALLAFSCASTSGISDRQGDSSVQEKKNAAEIYSQLLSSLKITLISTPKETVKQKSFGSPYVVRVESDDGKPLGNFELSALYPARREDGKIAFETTVITTNSDGTAEFMPPVPKYSFNSEISFFPAYSADGLSAAEAASMKEAADSGAVRAPFKAQTNLKAAGGVIAIVDLTQSGRASSNPVSSSNLLMTMMRLGFTQIGNAPVEIMNLVPAGDDAKIHARAKAMLGTSQNFLIYGTVRTDSSERTGSGFSCTLTGTVRAASMRTGEIMFATERTLTATGASEAAALANARKTLAEELAGEIRYGI